MPPHTPIAEVDANRHAVLKESEQYEVVRCVYDFDRERGESTVTLTMVHRHRDERRCLRFNGVICSHPLAEHHGIYIVNTAYRQWERRARVEVGEYFEEGGIYTGPVN